jgi:hypothetical protein
VGVAPLQTANCVLIADSALQAVKLYGEGPLPPVIDKSMVERYFKYDSAGKQFQEIGSTQKWVILLTFGVVLLGWCFVVACTQLLADHRRRLARSNVLQEAEGVSCVHFVQNLKICDCAKLRGGVHSDWCK